MLPDRPDRFGITRALINELDERLSGAHLLAALVGSLVSLLFALQHDIIGVVLLLCRPAHRHQVS